MTNGDKLRQMSDRELADMFAANCTFCVNNGIRQTLCLEMGDSLCEEIIEAWLKKGVSE
jgi:hypothetical protein